jgi:hypothetical protein
MVINVQYVNEVCMFVLIESSQQQARRERSILSFGTSIDPSQILTFYSREF